MGKVYRDYVKRAGDVAGSAMLIVLTAPLMVVISGIVRLGLGRPVVFRQARPGRGEKVFIMYKFRSMRDDRGPDGTLLPDHKRTTPLGKFLRKTSLDELPELFNILKGDMSFVGPRPLLVRYMPFYSASENRRHTVRPGVTGLAQVSGRTQLGWNERLALDVAYVDEVSFWLDMDIVMKTVRTVLSWKSTQYGSFGDLDIEREIPDIEVRTDDVFSPEHSDRDREAKSY